MGGPDRSMCRLGYAPCVRWPRELRIIVEYENDPTDTEPSMHSVVKGVTVPSRE